MANDIFDMQPKAATSALKQKNKTEYLPQWSAEQHEKGVSVQAELFNFLTEHHLLVHDGRSVYRFCKETSRFEKFNDKTWVYFVKLSLTQDTSPHISPKVCMDIKFLILAEYRMFRDFAAWEKNNTNLIGVAGGLWDANTRKVRPATPEDLTSDFYDFEYVEGAHIQQSPHFHKFVSSSLGYMEDKSSTTLLLEIFGYALSSSTKLRKLHILYGATSSGKSLALSLLMRVIGEDKVSNIPLHDLSSERYNIGELNGMKLNASTEISAKPLSNLSVLKRASASERLHGEIKYQRAVPFECKATLIYATNVMPSVSAKEKIGGDTSFFNRLNVLVFPVSIPADKAILDLDEKLWREKDIIMSLALNAFSDLAARNFRLTEPQRSVEFLENYIREEAKFSDFAQCCIEVVPGAKTSLKSIQKNFQNYCERNGLQYRPDSNEIKSYFRMRHPYDVTFKKIRVPREGSVYGFMNVKLIPEKEAEEDKDEAAASLGMYYKSTNVQDSTR